MLLIRFSHILYALYAYNNNWSKVYYLYNKQIAYLIHLKCNCTMENNEQIQEW